MKASLEVVDQTQWISFDGTFLLVLNVNDAPLGARLVTSLHREVGDRAAFLRSLFRGDLREALPSPAPVELDEVPRSGGVRRVSIRIALRQTGIAEPGQIFLSDGLGRTGAYPLEVLLVDQEGEELDTLVTHLVRLPAPDTEVIPLTTSLVLGLRAPPGTAPDGRAGLSGAAVDDIAAEVRAVATVPDVPVTFAPIPETIEAMARTGGRTAQLVAELRRVIGPHEVLDSPYVDVALTSWFEAGMDEELNRQRERGNAVLTGLLKSPDSSTWLASPELSADGAAKLWALGVRRLVLPPGSFETRPDGPDATPTRPFEVRTPLVTPLQAVAVDDSLAGRFTLSDDPQLAAHHLLSELAVIHDEAPDQRRGVVLTPPASWHPSSALLTTLLQDLAESPLLDAATVDELFATVPAAEEGPDEGGGPVVRELTPLPSPSLAAHSATLNGVRSRLNSYQGMVGPTAQVDGWLERLLVSGARSLTPAQRDRYLTVVSSTIAARVGTIEAPRRQTVTLTAREGRIPLTLRSGLREQVNVAVELETSRRLEFPDGNRVAVTLDPGTEQVDIRVRTRSPGDSPLEIRVVSPDGLLAIDSTRLTVRSTAVSGIGTVLSVGAAAFLLLWWVRHWRRARRARRHLAEDAAVRA